MADLVFACLAEDEPAGRRALLLTRSLRAFGGRMAGSSVWVLAPQAMPLPESVRDGLRAAGADLVPLATDRSGAGFPFGAKVLAAGVAEARAAATRSTLVWMDAGTLILREPDELHLPPGVALGARPVDLALIGSRLADPVSPFWDLIYRTCAVPADRLFPMESSVDEVAIRPYFNAGLLVVRPERGVLGRWATMFPWLYRDPRLAAFYREDERYAIFAHQALLAGVVLSSLEREGIEELPPWANYPLHLHERYPLARRPHALDEVTVCRYEDFFETPGWEKAVGEPLRGWLRRELSATIAR
ncbi:MAG TPA: hypothetical protein PLC08_03575 [Candidatus Bipolaricaulis sp.]|nr:hypothetical protein [Candidatus Bipolaricaulis sp.]HRS14420.1 hypothetical protein [Candidatus Bipolaricaulis sp.]HRU21238.1 hypothetical protein [Candidatus Bipolaricaulis sp.]